MKVDIVHFTPTAGPLFYRPGENERDVICVYRLDQIDLQERQAAWSGRSPLFAIVDESDLTLLQADPLDEENDEYYVDTSFAEKFRSERMKNAYEPKEGKMWRQIGQSNHEVAVRSGNTRVFFNDETGATITWHRHSRDGDVLINEYGQHQGPRFRNGSTIYALHPNCLSSAVIQAMSESRDGMIPGKIRGVDLLLAIARP